MAVRQTIFVSAYPKSGSTYLTRLLADILNSPSGGCMPSEDAKEVATEGQDRPGPYIVRKGHFVLIDDDSGPVVPGPHKMAYKQLEDEKVVFLVRDPRDICISGAYHWRQSSADFLDRMIKGDVAKCGRWDEYVNKWTSLYSIPALISYKDLIISPQQTIVDLLSSRFRLEKVKYAFGRVYEAIERQSFTSRKAQIGADQEELRRNNMRKGIVGDWRNHFTPEMDDKIWSEFGWIMERLGYDYR